jgi:Protein of unknown function DUF262/Protein of unknown function (DUF1524)
MKLDPKHLSLSALLHQRLFRIPDYQRAYAWQSKQRKDLFADILEVHKSGKDHFMATVVCLAKDRKLIGADEFNTVEIVDGQQRITTFTILFKAIEKILSSEIEPEAKLKREIGELLVKSDDHSLMLLQTNHDSSQVFLNYIRNGSIATEAAQSMAERNLIDAANECEEFVQEWKTTTSIIDLVALLRNRLSMIYHELHDEASVYRVFEVLNSRGLDVKWIDKVKSQLLALIFTHADSGARDDALDEMRSIWANIYLTLGLRSDIGDEALRFAGTWLSDERPNRLLSEEDAARVLITKAGSKLALITKAAENLKAIIVSVSALHNNRRLGAVTKISHARFLAAAVLRRGFPKNVEKELLGQWERITFRIFGLGGEDTRTKVGEYVRLAYDISNQQVITEVEISDRMKTLAEGYPIGEVLKVVGWDDSYNNWAEELRYLLFRYEEHLASEAGEMINTAQWNKIWSTDPSKSIEHITPQSSKRSFIHHLGNLTMLPPGLNSSLQDQPPKTKVKAYRECGLRGTVTVADTIKKNGNWTKELVDARTKKIEKFVRKEWAD